MTAAGVVPTLRFDVRRPDFAAVPPGAQYAACLEQCAWADRHGFDRVVLSDADGFLPAPLAVATAIAARTSRTRVTAAALLLPLYDAVRVAEDLAVADLISDGRVRVVAGIGYRDEEFALFGVERAGRGPRMEEQIRLNLRARSGAPVPRGGRSVAADKPATERSGAGVEAADRGDVTHGDLRACGADLRPTPEECADFARAQPPGAAPVFHPFMGGLDPAIGWESPELFAAKVVPRTGAGPGSAPPSGGHPEPSEAGSQGHRETADSSTGGTSPL